ncbi:glycosyltransferase family 4 protein [Bosea sp. 124]|uniref:glycosyltransferase family 4 protein n=1 Tax=Bosea sp. 124 TaxID=2135642 RepID=UPI000D3D126A|nr:glycosyltransferase family 4 protein [Bosea sp. 124]PTM41475.1 glycosyltransferase involved in cell wall biosynthesis [Bosea sp. 124]
MKVAYLVSHYPSPSHTFIEREIRALEETGIEVLRFSVRRPKDHHIVDETARDEHSKTRWLVPPAVFSFVAAVIWACFTRPLTLCSTFVDAVSGAKGLRSKFKWMAYWAEAILLAYWIVSADAAHLHCHFGNAGSNTAMIAAKLAGLPFSITFHGIDLNEPEAFRHPAKVRECAFAVCISEFGQRLLVDNVGAAEADKIHVVRCGYALPEQHIIPPLPGSNHIVCVARLSPEKGHDILIAALLILKRRGFPFSCTLVGGGPLDDEIRQRIAQAELDSAVTMVGIRTPEEVREHIAQADLAVLASYGEGIPIALMEAFAQKRPVAATNVGGIPELVLDGVNGRLVGPGSASAFADAIQSILSDHRAAERMGEAGWRQVGQMHDPATSTQQMHRLFTQSRLSEAA